MYVLQHCSALCKDFEWIVHCASRRILSGCSVHCASMRILSGCSVQVWVDCALCKYKDLEWIVHCALCTTLQCTVHSAWILSGWSEWAFITPRPLKNKLELPFDDDLDEDEENGEDDLDCWWLILCSFWYWIGISWMLIMVTLMNDDSHYEVFGKVHWHWIGIS